MKTKDKVNAAIIERLQSHSGIDVKSLDVSTTDVRFENNMAYATVAFRPKNAPSASPMSMKYTLENRDGKWVVTKVGDSAGHSMSNGSMQGGGGTGQMPMGHPSIDPSIHQGATPANPHMPAPAQ